MSDLREQLLKAGLVSAKQVRKAKHEERVHRKEVGLDGVAAEQADADRRFREEQEEKRRRDQEREQARRRREAEEEKTLAVGRWIRAGWVREATGGGSRFFFVDGAGRITSLDLNDLAIRRLQSGSAAIVETRGTVRGEYCVVDAGTAHSLSKDHGDLIRFWNRPQER